MGVGGFGVGVAVFVGGTGVEVGSAVGGTGVGVRVWKGSAVGSSSEVQALNPIAATTTRTVQITATTNRTPTFESWAGMAPKNFNSRSDYQRLARAVIR